MRILGVDPGNAVTGFGVVERSDAPRFVAAGTIRTAAIMRGPARLAAIHEKLLEVIDEHRPEAMSLERSFVAANVQSAFKLGEVRAMAMLACANRGILLFEYTPADVKLSITGYGRAGKDQVEQMVRRTLGLDDALELKEDAADALAIALCHLFRSKMLPREPERVMRPARVASSARR
jgi:crossover junction endodeoxyribonuclease RuvC